MSKNHYPQSGPESLDDPDSNEIAVDLRGHEVKLQCPACPTVIVYLSGYRDTGFYAVARCPDCNGWATLQLKPGTCATTLEDNDG